jgi:hypothetical protein
LFTLSCAFPALEKLRSARDRAVRALSELKLSLFQEGSKSADMEPNLA